MSLIECLYSMLANMRPRDIKNFATKPGHVIDRSESGVKFQVQFHQISRDNIFN